MFGGTEWSKTGDKQMRDIFSVISVIPKPSQVPYRINKENLLIFPICFWAPYWTPYVSKTVDANGKLVFTGRGPEATTALGGSAMGAATTAVESSSVSEANSVDDILVTDATSAKAALAVIDSALDMMSDFRAVLGASSNRMFITVDNLMSMSENTAASRSRIVDADFAAESAKLAKSQVLQKAGTAMLSQANASTQDILSLLK